MFIHFVCGELVLKVGGSVQSVWTRIIGDMSHGEMNFNSFRNSFHPTTFNLYNHPIVIVFHLNPPPTKKKKSPEPPPPPPPQKKRHKNQRRSFRNGLEDTDALIRQETNLCIGMPWPQSELVGCLDVTKGGPKPKSMKRKKKQKERQPWEKQITVLGYMNFLYGCMAYGWFSHECTIFRQRFSNFSGRKVYRTQSSPHEREAGRIIDDYPDAPCREYLPTFPLGCGHFSPFMYCK